MLAAGGIWAEVMRDRSIRLAPVSVDTAREMIAEVKLLQTVSGLRGKARAIWKRWPRPFPICRNWRCSPCMGCWRRK
jgi:hypothetical protein